VSTGQARSQSSWEAAAAPCTSGGDYSLPHRRGVGPIGDVLPARRRWFDKSFPIAGACTTSSGAWSSPLSGAGNPSRPLNRGSRKWRTFRARYGEARRPAESRRPRAAGSPPPASQGPPDPLFAFGAIREKEALPSDGNSSRKSKGGARMRASRRPASTRSGGGRTGSTSSG
jgi:hypothetical protein